MRVNLSREALVAIRDGLKNSWIPQESYNGCRAALKAVEAALCSFPTVAQKAATQPRSKK